MRNRAHLRHSFPLVPSGPSTWGLTDLLFTSGPPGKRAPRAVEVGDTIAEPQALLWYERTAECLPTTVPLDCGAATGAGFPEPREEAPVGAVFPATRQGLCTSEVSARHRVRPRAGGGEPGKWEKGRFRAVDAVAQLRPPGSTTAFLWLLNTDESGAREWALNPE